MDREQLRMGLYYVKERVDRIFAMNQRKSQLEAQFRGEVQGLNNTGMSGLVKTLVIFIGAISILFEMYMVFGRGYDDELLYLVATAGGYIILVPKFLGNTIRKNKKTIIAGAALGIGVMGGGFDSAMQHSLGIFYFVGISILAIPVVALGIGKHSASVNRKNQQIREYNAQVFAEVDRCDAVIAQCQAELRPETNAWFPVNYCYKDAVDWFVTAVENYRCDSVKELIRECEADARHREVMQSQADLRRSMETGFNQVIHNQREMSRLMRVNNALAVANVTATIQNTRAVERNISAVNHVSSQINAAMGTDTIF